jgi:small subunit ribosomal protein S6
VIVLRKYEVVYVLRPDLDEEKNAALVEKFKDLIESQGGEIIKIDKWGKRRLAYEVKDLREGVYILIHMNAEPKVATELDRIFKITDEVLRHIIVREDL